MVGPRFPTAPTNMSSSLSGYLSPPDQVPALLNQGPFYQHMALRTEDGPTPAYLLLMDQAPTNPTQDPLACMFTQDPSDPGNLLLRPQNRDSVVRNGNFQHSARKTTWVCLTWCLSHSQGT